MAIVRCGRLTPETTDADLVVRMVRLLLLSRPLLCGEMIITQYFSEGVTRLLRTKRFSLA